MKPRQQVSRAGLELIERFEGYRRKAAQLPNGRWTIGYGHTLTARKGAEVSQADAEALLIYDLMAVAQAVSDLTFAPLSQNQFDALCAFAFNVGLDDFRASEVLKKVNEGALTEAAFAMELWRKAEFEGEIIVIDGLVRRRAAEKLLFLTPPGAAWVPVPTGALKPRRDGAAAALAPQERPAPVVTPLEGEAVAPVLEREPETASEAVLPPLDPQPPEPPPEAAGDESPLTAAAEAVTGRLSTLFKDEPVQGPAVEITPEPEAEAAPEPQRAEEAPFALSPPERDPAELPDLEFEAEREAETESESAEPVADLFAANDAEAVAAEPVPEAPEAQAGEGRVVIDDTAPYEFVPPLVQPLPQRATEGYLSLAVMAVLGLAFIAGGLFWAVNAQPGVQPGFLAPKMVGGLASVAGVGLFSITVYLFLQRLGAAAERDVEERRR